MSPLVPIPIILKGDSAECVGEFRTTFRTIPAFVRLVRNSKPQYWWGSAWGFSKSLERETPFFGTQISQGITIPIDLAMGFSFIAPDQVHR